MSQSTIEAENKSYWTGRASGYSEVNQLELATEQRQKWSACLKDEIAKQFPNRAPQELRVLEVGTGPGFFAILLCELGHDVTAIDLTPAMLKEAKKNAGTLAGEIQWMEMNAQARVLKPGGLLLNFDANWYAYLFDDAARQAFDRDRANSAKQGVCDQNVGENFDVMEDIARRVPLSGIRRPDWDLRQLSKLGLSAEADETVWQRVWSEEEKLNFASTPLFLVRDQRAPMIQR